MTKGRKWYALTYKITLKLEREKELEIRKEMSRRVVSKRELHDRSGPWNNPSRESRGQAYVVEYTQTW
jgi:hypothetical protein